MAWETYSYSCTSPYIHSWIVETLWIIIFWVWVLTHPTPPHPYMTHSTLPHPFMTHPYMTHPTPPLHDPPTPPYPFPTPPHPWYIFGHKGAFFHGLLHYVSLPVDNKTSFNSRLSKEWFRVSHLTTRKRRWLEGPRGRCHMSVVTRFTVRPVITRPDPRCTTRGC